MTADKYHKPHWTSQQRIRLHNALVRGKTVAYVVTDAHGLPSNGGDGTRCFPGAKHAVKGPLQLCSEHALHGTYAPHKWRGARVWVAVFGAVRCDDDKVGALSRTIIGEILPAECCCPSVALRLGPRALARANLTDANLTDAYLAGANLADAYLARANLTDANLTRAYLAGANLIGANLTRAYLADADLDGAYLAGANLAGANLTRAYLAGANLTGANLTRAYLVDADLDGAYLAGANLAGAHCPCPPLAITRERWVEDSDGYLHREEKE